MARKLSMLLSIVLLGCPIKSMDATIAVGKFFLCKIEPSTIEEQIIAVLIDSGFTIHEQRIILAQSKHESGHYRNSISKKNNVFGLHKSRKSKFALPEKIKAEGCNCFASYRSVKDATLDYLRYRRELKIPSNMSLEAYVAHIKKMGYFEDNEKKYLRSLKRLIKRDTLFINQFNTQYTTYRLCRTDGSFAGLE